MLGNLESIQFILPEIVLAGTIVLLFFLTFFKGAEKQPSTSIYGSLTLIGIIISLAVAATLHSKESAMIFMGMASFDGMGLFFKYIFGVAAVLTVILSQRSKDLAQSDSPSYYILILVLTMGMNFLAMASNLLMIYLALEMVSISSYLLTGYSGSARRSTEAALKYVIYGGVASGVMIYGFSLFFGLTGTLQLNEIAEFLQFNATDRAVLFLALIMSLAGFGFKVAAFPFHMWSPDVYEGAPTPFTAFLSVGPKAAGFAVLIRYLLIGLFFADGTEFIDIKTIGISDVLSYLAIATMTVGNLIALRQQNMKRLLAYSSVAHAGYMLMGLAALNQAAVESVMLYMVVYLVMNIGAFLVVIIVSNQFGVEKIADYAGLSSRGPRGAAVAVAMTLFMFSLTGLPPTAGFIGKLYLFKAVISSELYVLAVIGALNSVIALYYYMYVVKVMFFDKAENEDLLAQPGLSYSTLLGALAILTLYLGVFWQPVAEWVQASTQMLR